MLDAVAAALGADRVVTPVGSHTGAATMRLGPNVGLYDQRDVAGVIRPRTADEVRRVVAIVAGSADPVALQPMSTGHNWGLGSREPADNGAVILDLSGMDRVRAIDTTAGWAVVEPGVTQGELAKRLAGTARKLNLTASSMHTSVVGNALDRGVGLLRQRVEDLAGLEVVLPSGEMMRVGWWPSDSGRTPLYPHGLGPSALPLFLQSNLGVVTAAAIRLPPAPEALLVVRLNFTRSHLREAVDLVRHWVSQGLTHGVPKVYDPAAAKAYHGTEDEFLVHVCVAGTMASAEALTKVLIDEAVASGVFTQVTHTDRADPDPDVREVATLVELGYAGQPDDEDALFQAKMRVPADDVDSAGGGFLFFLPLVPFTGEAIAQATELLDRVHETSGIRCGATMNMLDADVVDFVVTMRFSPDDESAAHAHETLDRMYGMFGEAGFLPYRLDVDHADAIDHLSPDPAARRFIRHLKDVLDPRTVIAPGRYG
ncbi:hypothetical protein ALI144C_36660 [Actinosynnema sp. ALI-1.44]|nr:hypothetical protein ALI144C_36660 [Actinosynnema sp. ALI-1.44]